MIIIFLKRKKRIFIADYRLVVDQLVAIMEIKLLKLQKKREGKNMEPLWYYYFYIMVVIIQMI